MKAQWTQAPEFTATPGWYLLRRGCITATVVHLSADEYIEPGTQLIRLCGETDDPLATIRSVPVTEETVSARGLAIRILEEGNDTSIRMGRHRAEGRVFAEN